MRGRDEIFLSQSDREKMSLFRRIVNSRVAQIPVAERLKIQRAGKPLVTDVNLKQVASLLGRNYGSVYNTYNGLVESLQEIVGTRNTSVVKLFNIPSSEVRNHFVIHGDAYRFLIALLTHPYENFDTFLSETDSSNATMLRHLKPLREFARQFGVKFSYANVQVRGEERRVRLFLTTALWLATDGAAWPFEEINREAMSQMTDYAIRAYDVGVPNVVNREIAMYYFAVTAHRIADGQAFDYDPGQFILNYPSANIFEDINISRAWNDQKRVALSTSAQLAESATVYFFFNFLPFFISTDSSVLERAMKRYERYNPEIYTIITEFIEKAPVNFLIEPGLPRAARHMLKANLISSTVSILEFGHDMTSVVANAINDRLRLVKDNLDMEQRVRQTLEHVIFTNKLTGLEGHLEELSQSYANHLIQLAIQFVPIEKVRVAPVIEQSMLGYIDLLSFLINVPFVEIAEVGDPENPVDLVVESATVPGVDYGVDVPVYKWAGNTSNDWFGELYSTIRQIWDDKMSISGRVDY